MAKSLLNNDITLLSAMLAPSMRNIFKDNLEIMETFISKETLKLFKGLEEIMPKNLTPEGLSEILKLKGNQEFDSEVIVKTYSMAYSDSTSRVVYESARASLYQLYLNSLKGGSIHVIEAIKANKLYFPPYGFINSEYSNTTGFTDIKLGSLSEMLGRSFKSSLDFINRNTINESGYFEDQVIAIMSPPGCGKSLFCMDEAVSALLQGFRVHYTALGDLSELDFISRVSSNLLKLPMMNVYANIERSYTDVISKYPELNNLTIEFTAPGVYTVTDWLDRLKHTGALEKNDVFIVDYDANFKTLSDNIYMKGDEIFTELVLLAKTYHKIVLVVSQPKLTDWKSGLTLSSMSESARKQHHADMILAMSPDFDVKNPSNIIGTFDILKNRRGPLGRCHYFREPTGRFTELSKMMYEAAKISREKTYYEDFTGCSTSEYVKLSAPNILEDIDDAKSKLKLAEESIDESTKMALGV